MNALSAFGIQPALKISVRELCAEIRERDRDAIRV
jgi:hypothetical protein